MYWVANDARWAAFADGCAWRMSLGLCLRSYCWFPWLGRWPVLAFALIVQRFRQLSWNGPRARICARAGDRAQRIANVIVIVVAIAFGIVVQTIWQHEVTIAMEDG